MGRSFQMAGNEMRMAGTGITMAIAPIVGMMTLNAKGAAEFEGQLKTLQVIGKGTEDQMASARENLLRLSSAWGTSVGEITEAAIEFAAVGFTMEESILMVEASTVLARGGLGTQEQATVLLTQASKQFGIEVEDVGSLMDAFAYIANETSSRVSDLSTSFGYVGTVANTVGLSVNETATIIGVIHNQLQDASMSGTSFRQVLMKLIDPPAEANAVMKSLGITLYNTNGEMKPFVEVIEEFNTKLALGNEITTKSIGQDEALIAKKKELKSTMEDLRHAIATSEATDPNLEALKTQMEEIRHEYNTLNQLSTRLVEEGLIKVDEAFRNQAIATVFGVRGMNAFNAVTAAGIPEIERLLAGTQKSGYAIEAAAGITEGAKYQFDILSQSIKNTGIEIGTELLPMLLELAQEIRGSLPMIKEVAASFTGGFISGVKVVAGAIGFIVNALSQLPKPAADAIMAFAGVMTMVLAIVGPLLIFTGMIISSIGSIITLTGVIASSTTIMGALGTAVATLTGPIGIIIAAIALLALAWKYNLGGMRESTAELVDRIRPIITEVVQFINEQFTKIGLWWDENGPLIIAAVDVIVTHISSLLADFSVIVTAIFSVVVDVIGWALPYITAIVSNFVDITLNVFKLFAQLLTGDWVGLFDTILDIVRLMVDTIRIILVATWDGIKTGVKTLGTILIGLWDTIMTTAEEKLSTLPEDAYTWGKNLVTGFVDGVRAMLSSVEEVGGDIADSIKAYIGFSSPTEKGAGQDVMKWGPNLMKSFTDGLVSGKDELEKTMDDITSGLTPEDVRLKPRIHVDLSTVVDELRKVADEIADMAQTLIVVDELGLETGEETMSGGNNISLGIPTIDFGAILTPTTSNKTPIQTIMESINTTNITDSSTAISNMMASDQRRSDQTTTHIHQNDITIQVKEVASKGSVDQLISELNNQIVKTTRNQEILGL